jgi:glycosyltransferase involved in cell wall biosynthesis
MGERRIQMSVMVSVNIPTCNRVDLLKRAVNSVINQTFDDWEIIIVDNSGTDEVRWYLEALGCNKIKLFPHVMDETTLAGMRNVAIERSSGKYIAILDDDDEFYNRQKLAQQVSFLEAFPEYKVVGTNTIVHTPDFKTKGKKLYPQSDEQIRKSMLVACPFCHSTTMFKKEDVLSVGGYKPIEGERENNEYLLWLELGLRGKLCNLPMIGVNYTMGHKKRNIAHNLKLHRENFKTVYAYRDMYPNMYKAIFKYAIVYPLNYIRGVKWEK